MRMVKYLHASMYGMFESDCEILGKNEDGDFLIRYTDPIMGTIEKRTVYKDDLIFPEFSEYLVP